MAGKKPDPAEDTADTQTPALETEAGVLSGSDTVTYREPEQMGDGRHKHSASLLGNTVTIYTDTADTRSPRAALRSALKRLTNKDV